MDGKGYLIRNERMNKPPRDSLCSKREEAIQGEAKHDGEANQDHALGRQPLYFRLEVKHQERPERCNDADFNEDVDDFRSFHVQLARREDGGTRGRVVCSWGVVFPYMVSKLYCIVTYCIDAVYCPHLYKTLPIFMH